MEKNMSGRHTIKHLGYNGHTVAAVHRFVDRELPQPTGSALHAAPERIVTLPRLVELVQA